MVQIHATWIRHCCCITTRIECWVNISLFPFLAITYALAHDTTQKRHYYYWLAHTYIDIIASAKTLLRNRLVRNEEVEISNFFGTLFSWEADLIRSQHCDHISVKRRFALSRWKLGVSQVVIMLYMKKAAAGHRSLFVRVLHIQQCILLCREFHFINEEYGLWLVIVVYYSS